MHAAHKLKQKHITNRFQLQKFSLSIQVECMTHIKAVYEEGLIVILLIEQDKSQETER